MPACNCREDVCQVDCELSLRSWRLKAVTAQMLSRVRMLGTQVLHPRWARSSLHGMSQLAR